MCFFSSHGYAPNIINKDDFYFKEHEQRQGLSILLYLSDGRNTFGFNVSIFIANCFRIKEYEEKVHESNQRNRKG